MFLFLKRTKVCPNENIKLLQTQTQKSIMDAVGVASHGKPYIMSNTYEALVNLKSSMVKVRPTGHKWPREPF